MTDLLDSHENSTNIGSEENTSLNNSGGNNRNNNIFIDYD